MNSVLSFQDTHPNAATNQPSVPSDETDRVETREAAPGTTHLGLQITRGRTNYRERPIWRDRFLIGSDENCDLQLGGADIPLLHSLIYFDGESYHIESLLAAPPLLINKCRQTSAVIVEGDEIELGEFRFVVCRIRPSDALTGTLDVSENELNAFDDVPDADAISELSASELVDRLEAEMAAVDQFESGRELGVEAMLDAVAERIRATDSIASVRENDMNRVIESLDQLVVQLERRSNRLAEHEASLTQAASQLLDVQHRLSEQMGVLLESMEAMRHEEDSRLMRPRRAIA